MAEGSGPTTSPDHWSTRSSEKVPSKGPPSQYYLAFKTICTCLYNFAHSGAIANGADYIKSFIMFRR
jgi:hypothetical protein